MRNSAEVVLKIFYIMFPKILKEENKMRKKVVCVIVTIIVLAILFVPIPLGKYDDGGTRDYGSLTYKIVVWNRLQYNESTQERSCYKSTCVYWLPDNYKSIGELWKINH